MFDPNSDIAKKVHQLHKKIIGEWFRDQNVKLEVKK